MEIQFSISRIGKDSPSMEKAVGIRDRSQVPETLYLYELFNPNDAEEGERPMALLLKKLRLINSLNDSRN